MVKTCYDMCMVKKIEIGISGSRWNSNSFNWIEGLATRLLIHASVFTKSDGSIGVMAEGEEQTLEAFAEKIHNGGIFSRIENFFVKWNN